MIRLSGQYQAKLCSAAGLVCLGCTLAQSRPSMFAQLIGERYNSSVSCGDVPRRLCRCTRARRDRQVTYGKGWHAKREMGMWVSRCRSSLRWIPPAAVAQKRRDRNSACHRNWGGGACQGCRTASQEFCCEFFLTSTPSCVATSVVDINYMHVSAVQITMQHVSAPNELHHSSNLDHIPGH